MELLHSVIDDIHLSLRLGGVTPNKYAQLCMQLWDHKIMDDEIGLVLRKIGDQLGIWLARSPGFNGKLQVVVKCDLDRSLPLRFALHLGTPVDVR